MNSMLIFGHSNKQCSSIFTELTSREWVRLNGLTDLNSYFLISDSNTRGITKRVEISRQERVCKTADVQVAPLDRLLLRYSMGNRTARYLQ